MASQTIYLINIYILLVIKSDAKSVELSFYFYLARNITRGISALEIAHFRNACYI